MTLLWRVFATNAAVLVVAVLALVLSPVTVSSPVLLTELVALAAGLAAMLVTDLVMLRRAFGPPMAGQPEVERRDRARRTLAAQEAERRRIARELHDEVGQALTAVVLQLDSADRLGADGVAAARETVREALEEVRGIARGLRPEALDELGLASALAALTNAVGRRTGLPLQRRIAPEVPSLDADEELVVYRVAQEALTNVVRHAHARSARLVLAVSDGQVVLEVRDAGAGFDPAGTASGTGIAGMRERALLVGAELEIGSVPGEGTSVLLRLRRRR